MTIELFWEDFAVGDVHDLGCAAVSREEILDFARAFDPQPFHVDDAAAAESPFGGLVASGWHTCAMFMRLYADQLLNRSASQGSPGLEELRWRVPVRPGDTLHARAEVVEVTPSAKRPDRGTVVMRWEMANQHGETVLTMRGRGLFGRRHSAG